MKIKTIYDRLKPGFKSSLQKNARQYSSAKRLKYTLMSKMMWSELQIDQVRDLLTYGNLDSWKLNSYSFMYGEKIIDKS